MVLVQITEVDYVATEMFGKVALFIFQNKNLANNITIKLHPVTYDQYQNVLGLSVPDDLQALVETEGK